MTANSIKKKAFFVLFFVCMFFTYASDGTEDADNSNSIDETKIELDAKSQKDSPAESASTNVPEEDSNFDMAVKEKPRSSSSRLLQLLGALIIVCILAYIVIKFLKKSTTVFGVDDPYLKTVASMNIDQGKSVHVISLGEKAYLLGVTDASVNLIAEVDDKNLIDAMNLEAERKSDMPKKDFSSVLSQFFPNIKKEEKKIGKDFFTSQSERLNRANQNQSGSEE